MKICPTCGNQLNDDAKYCTKCLNLVSGGSAPAGSPSNTFNMYSNPYSSAESYAPNNKASRIVGISAACAAGVAVFLPFIEINAIFMKQSISMMSDRMSPDGYVLMIIAVIVLIANAAGKTKVANLVGGTLITGLTILEYYLNQESVASGFKYDLSRLLSPGLGFYLLVAAGIAMLVAGFIHKKQ